MAERYVRMNVLSSGTEKAKASLDDLAARARALEADSPDVKVNVDDTQAVVRMKDLKLKIDILNRERAEISVNMKGDEATKAKLLDIKARLRSLDEKVTPEIKLKDADRTEAQLIKIKLLMDSIHNKKVDVAIAEGKSGSWLARLARGSNKSILGIPKGAAGGGGGGDGAAAGLLNGSPGAFLTNPIVAGPLGSLLASLLPSVAGLGVGGLVGGGGVGLSAILAGLAGSKIQGVQSAFNKAQTKLASNPTAANEQTAFSDYIKLQNKEQRFSPFTNLAKDAKGLIQPLFGIIAPFAKALDPMIKDLGKFEIAIGPQLSKMFMASLPFVKQFLGVMMQGGKTLIPAFTMAMQTMVKSGALSEMMQAFVLLLKDGLVPFLKILGPGMKASATVFKAVIIALNGVLIGLAVASTFIAREMALLGHAVVDVGKVFYSIGRIVGALLTGNWKAMDNAVAALGNNFRNFFATLLHLLSDGFGKVSQFGHDVAHVFDYIRHSVAQEWDATWSWVGHRFTAFYNDDQHMMQNLRHSIADTFDAIRHSVAASWDGMLKMVENSAMQSFRSVLNDFTSWRHDIANGFDILRHSVASVWNSLWRDLKNITSSGVRGVGVAIHGIESAFRTPIAFVVNDVWDRLAGIWNKITGIVHLGSLKLPIAHFADGGRVTQGSGPRSDDVLARVSKGETVVSAAHSQALAPIFSAVGIPGYASGGIPNPIKAVGGFFSGLGHDVLKLLAKPASFIMSKFFGGVEGMLGHLPGVSPAMDSVLTSLTKTLLSTLVGKAHNAGQAQFSTGKFTGHVGAGVQQWRGTVMKALGLEGLPLGLTNQVLFQMMTESGGNPNAINLTDSNAAAGDPSRGLLQTIMSTFRAYHWPGTSGDIYNPLANVAAAINYARHVYGPTLMRGGMGLGSGHGYLNGGWINEPVSGIGLHSGQHYSFAENGLPEYVSPHGAHGGGGGGNIYITVQGDTDPDAAARRIHQKLRKYKTKHGNQALGLA